MISEDRQPPFFLGIDLGGTNIKSGVVDDAGRPFAGVSLETEAERGPEVGLRNIAEAGKLAVKASGLDWSQITAVGLGSPGTMDIHAGLLLNPPNLPGWVNLPIRERLSEMLGKPTVLQNDANAAAFGEYWSARAGAPKAWSFLPLARASAAGSSTTAESSKAGTATAANAGTSSFKWRGAHLLLRQEGAPRGLCFGDRAGQTGGGSPR